MTPSANVTAWFFSEEIALAIMSVVRNLHHPVDLSCISFDRTTMISLFVEDYPVEVHVPSAATEECMFRALTMLEQLTG